MLKIAITVFDVFFSFSEFYDEDDRKLKKAIRRINIKEAIQIYILIQRN